MSDAVCRDYAEITDVRASDPQAIERAWLARTIRPAIRGNGRLMIVAADHPARGALGVGSRPTAMNSRTDLLDRLRAALADPGVDGVLATADILDDLLLLGALEDKVVFSSMNRGGLAGAQFELDDRMTATTAAATAAAVRSTRAAGPRLRSPRRRPCGAAAGRSQPVCQARAQRSAPCGRAPRYRTVACRARRH